MKKITLYCTILLLTQKALSQNVGIGTNNPNSSAALDISSTSKGLLIPRLTTAEISSISNPAEGLMVFDIIEKIHKYYSIANGWRSIGLSFPTAYIGTINTPLLYLRNDNSAATVPVISARNYGNSDAIFGIGETTFSGIRGENYSNGKGVSGYNSMNGHGVHARGVDGTALYADIPSGTGIAGKFKQTNTAGKALEVEGNVRIFAGNTSPAAGKVLTSDATGNATWQTLPIAPKVGFSVSGMTNDGAGVQLNNVWQKVHFASEHFDIGNDYTNRFQTPSSTFTVPFTGLYQLNTQLSFVGGAISGEYVKAGVQFKLERNGVATVFGSNIDYMAQPVVGEWKYINLSGAFYLLAGDKIWVEALAQDNDDTHYTINYFDPSSVYFNGFLIMTN
ncbi:MAG: hypothetical protein U0V75_10650 [Ferruginibacter sp.]